MNSNYFFSLVVRCCSSSVLQASGFLVGLLTLERAVSKEKKNRTWVIWNWMNHAFLITTHTFNTDTVWMSLIRITSVCVMSFKVLSQKDKLRNEKNQLRT